jgi:V8-like Glu-specific endopeptidase
VKEQKHYISLKFKGGNAYHQNGKRLKLTERTINIGETADCDVRYETDCLQPEYYASIIRNEDGKSWRIVKRSQHVDVSLEGKGSIGYAHSLADGDIIQIENQTMTLIFHSHYDERYDEEDRQSTWQWAVAGILGLTAIIAVVFGLSNKQDVISVEDVEPLEESVCLVKVDSVRRLSIIDGKITVIPPTKILEGDAPTGTAFLTTDGKLVTARHCVEYWIGTDLDLTTKVNSLDENDIVRWAIETETFNQAHDGDSAMLQVFFSFFDFIGNKKYSFATTDKRVHINKDNDGVFLMADFSQESYWRTIKPYFNDRKMELGDILWIDSLKEEGKVKIANTSQMEKVKTGTKLMICGYPKTGIGDKRMVFTEGTIRRPVSANTENLFFESNINHGFSGGPVLMKDGNGVVVIGVVSRVDSISSGLYKWAVPITEVRDKK